MHRSIAIERWQEHTTADRAHHLSLAELRCGVAVHSMRTAHAIAASRIRGARIIFGDDMNIGARQAALDKLRAAVAKLGRPASPPPPHQASGHHLTIAVCAEQPSDAASSLTRFIVILTDEADASRIDERGRCCCAGKRQLCACANAQLRSVVLSTHESAEEWAALIDGDEAMEIVAFRQRAWAHVTELGARLSPRERHLSCVQSNT
jgi:hypothetical protein